jgi:hypothetical protein
MAPTVPASEKQMSTPKLRRDEHEVKCMFCREMGDYKDALWCFGCEGWHCRGGECKDACTTRWLLRLCARESARKGAPVLQMEALVIK